MGTNDGTVLGTTKILDNGSNNSKLNIVIVAEGFKEDQQDEFNQHCSDFVSTFENEPWYPAIGNAFNIHRINVSSTDEGADDPICMDPEFPGTGATSATYFDATFCSNGSIHRSLNVDWDILVDVLDANVPEWHTGYALVNTFEDQGAAQRGGSASSLLKVAAGSTAGHTLEEYKHVILHEIGHSLFDLRDEYDDLYANWVGADPGDPNVTTEANIANLKWKNLVAPELITENLIPTMTNPGCGDSGELPNVLDDDQKIGLFEGARRYHCGIYRPAYLCRMRRILYQDSSAPIPFCKVCVQAMVNTVIDSGIVTPSPHIEVWTENNPIF